MNKRTIFLFNTTTTRPFQHHHTSCSTPPHVLFNTTTRPFQHHHNVLFNTNTRPQNLNGHQTHHPQDLKSKGYDVGDVPATEEDLIKSVLNQQEARFNSADLNIAYRMNVGEYEHLCEYSEALEENWGKVCATDVWDVGEGCVEGRV